MEWDRFDPDGLDPLDPFELDEANIPHLHKHGFTTDDLYDIWADPDARSRRQPSRARPARLASETPTA